MEFVVVCPLYFLLLGGLFMVGGFVLNRLRMHVGDHLVTWVGGSRFCPTTAKDSSEKSADAVQRLASMLFDHPIGGLSLQDDGFEVRYDDDASKVNSFMGLYFGGITSLPVDLPAWLRGMMGMQGAMTGDGTSEWFLLDTASYACGHFRSYSFHRLPMTGVDDGGDPSGDVTSRSKKIRAVDVVTRGYLEAVLNETMMGSGRSSGEAATLGSAVNIPDGRMLGRFGE